MPTQSRYRRVRAKPGVILAILQRFRSEHMMQTSSALAFTTLMALVPLVTLVLSVADAVPYLNLLTRRLDLLFQESLLPAAAASAISGGIGRFSHRAQQLTVPGIALLSVTAFVLMLTIERTFNHLWLVKPRPYLARVRLYVFVMAVWPFLLAAIAAVISFAVTTSLGFFDEPMWIRKFVLKAASVLLLWLFFAFLYYAVPNVRVPRRNALAGGAFAALAFAGMQKLFELYLSSSAVLASVYGAFAALPVFLVWLHLSWAVILMGGLVAAMAFRPTRR